MTDSSLHAAFLAHVLPVVERHARIQFRGMRCQQQRAERLAECVALAWRWFVRMAQRNKDATQFPTAVATFAARAVRSGRRLCGQEPAKDALSEVAQRRHGFSVGKLPDVATMSNSPLQAALIDNTQTPVPEQVSFRLDFPAWLATLTDRERRIVEEMAQGEATIDLAARHGLSPARVSQLRREFCAGWKAFHGDRRQP